MQKKAQVHFLDSLTPNKNPQKSPQKPSKESLKPPNISKTKKNLLTLRP